MRLQVVVTLVATLVVTLVVLAACSPMDEGAAPSTSVTSTPPAPSAPATAAPVESSDPVAPTEPTGVPGIEDPDAWCAAWARYAGSLQIISVAIAFGGIGEEEAARLELTAAPAVRAAVAEIGAGWPAALVVERDAVLEGLLGPFDRRAARAVDALVAAGATEADLAVLRDGWADVLRRRDPDLPTVELPSLRTDLGDIVAVAAADFAASATRFDQDPSLVVDSSRTPATRAALARDCPALASSGVGDAI